MAATHRMTKTRFYKIWGGMKTRCLNKKERTYLRYGAKGIGVSQEWMNFINFKNDMYVSYLKHVECFGERNTTLDRINGLKGYGKENCRWATIREQGENRNNNHLLTYNGETFPLSVWARRIGINRESLLQRLQNGFTPEQAIKHKWGGKIRHGNLERSDMELSQIRGRKKLNADMVKSIISERKEGVPIIDIATKYGITRAYVSDIINGKSRSRVTGLKRNSLSELLGKIGRVGV